MKKDGGMKCPQPGEILQSTVTATGSPAAELVVHDQIVAVDHEGHVVHRGESQAKDSVLNSKANVFWIRFFSFGTRVIGF